MPRNRERHLIIVAPRVPHGRKSICPISCPDAFKLRQRVRCAISGNSRQRSATSRTHVRLPGKTTLTETSPSGSLPHSFSDLLCCSTGINCRRRRRIRVSLRWLHSFLVPDWKRRVLLFLLVMFLYWYRLAALHGPKK